jgi:hypothetical protein
MYVLASPDKDAEETNDTITQTTETQDPFADQSESLYWTALMITGSAGLAERSIIDATGLAETGSRDFRDWLVLWAHLATARTALNAVRSSIQVTGKRYADWTCSHHSHEPLSMRETRTLQKLDPSVVVQQLDVVARSVLVLRGCHGASFDDCVFLLNVPLQSAIGAYCTAVGRYGKSRQPNAMSAGVHVPTKLGFAIGSLMDGQG